MAPSSPATPKAHFIHCVRGAAACGGAIAGRAAILLHQLRPFLNESLALVRQQPRRVVGTYALARLLFAHVRWQVTKRLALRAFVRKLTLGPHGAACARPNTSSLTLSPCSHMVAIDSNSQHFP